MTLHELWDSLIPSGRRPLGAIIIFSVILHGLVFLAFKVVHDPTPISGVSRQSRVYMLNSSFDKSDNGREIHRWLDLMDPTLVAVPAVKPTMQELKATLFPDSTESWPQVANPLPAIPSRAKPERPVDSLGDLAQQAENSLKNESLTSPMPIPVETPPSISGTQYSIEGGLANRTILRKDALPKPRSSITLRSTELRFSVDQEGSVAHVLVEESSGDSAVDALAVKALLNWYFGPKKNGNTEEWGKMTIFWDQQPLVTPSQPVKS